ncbi:hypothetical protein BGZ94_008473 [Podila epigama]|nr:hypothetical protein BGZ94_008473 [Podila epigama]
MDEEQHTDNWAWLLDCRGGGNRTGEGGWGGRGGMWRPGGGRGDGSGGGYNFRGGYGNRFLESETSYLVATCYLSFITVVAIIMTLRSRTRLRIVALFTTFLGLTIAIVGYIRVKNIIGSNWFWFWNFFAEGLAVVPLTVTIVSVGAGFYPLTGKRSSLWIASIVVVFAYAVFTTINLAVYIYQKMIPRAMSGPELVQLRWDVIDKFDTDECRLAWDRYRDFKDGWISSGDYNATAVTGVSGWKELSSLERSMFSRPDAIWYLAHQLAMLFNCLWVCIYLFVPLVRSHRNGPVGRPIDSEMMAIGVWYLTVLTSVGFMYVVLNVVYIFNQEFIFEDQAQALDLCVRITIGPLFFLPAPKALFRFYRNHFKAFRSGGGGNSSQNQSGGKNTDSLGTTQDSRNFHGVSSRSGGISQFQSSGRFNSPTSRDSLDLDSDPKHKADTNSQHGSSFGTSDGTRYSKSTTATAYTSNSSTPHGRMKLFLTRDRGLSVESSRVLNNDFEYEERTSNHSEDHPDSFHQYYSNMDITRHHLRDTLASSPVGGRTEAAGLGFVPTSPITEPPVAHVRIRDECHTERPDNDISTSQGTTQKKNQDENASSPEPQQVTPSLTTVATTTNPTPVVPNITELTGLQKQLAEYRADLLPRVIALKEYHEDMRAEDADELRLRTRATYDYEVVVKNTNSLTTMDNTIDTSSEYASPSPFPLSPEMSDPSSTSPVSKLTKPASSTALGRDAGQTKSKDGILSVFSKALTGGANSRNGAGHSHRKSSDMKDGLDEDDESGGRFMDSNTAHNNPPNTVYSPISVEELTEASASSMGQSHNQVHGGSAYMYTTNLYEDKTGPNKNSRQPTQPMQKGEDTKPVFVTNNDSSPVARSDASADAHRRTGSSTDAASSPVVPKETRPTTSRKSHQQPQSPRSPRSPRSHPDVQAYREKHSMEAPRSPLTSFEQTSPSSPSSASRVVQPSNTSLSPPPRHSWRPAKSNRSTSPQNMTAIDTRLANEGGRETNGTTASSSATSASRTSSSQSSPMADSYTREGTPEGLVQARPSVDSARSQDNSRTNSLDRHQSTSREPFAHSSITPISPHLTDRQKRQQQPSGNNNNSNNNNNIASHYYRRANEHSAGGGPIAHHRSKNSIGTLSSSSPTTPTSIRIAHPSSLSSPTSPPSPQPPGSTGVGYFHRHHQAQSSLSSMSSSPATSPGPGGSIDRSSNGRNSPSYDYYAATAAHGKGNTGRTDSFTHQNTILADDPWTMAMINRAQAQHQHKQHQPSPALGTTGNYDRPAIYRTTSE